jgi:hypothetical protein
LQKRFELKPPDEEFFSAGPADLVQKAAAMTGVAPEAVADCGGARAAMPVRQTIN